MTYEQVVEELAKEIFNCFYKAPDFTWRNCSEELKKTWRNWVKEKIIDKRVGNLRVAVVEDGAELPKNPYAQDVVSTGMMRHHYDIYAQAQADMLKAGFVKVKEVKEK